MTTHKKLVILMLAFLALVSLLSARGDSATMDELAHIPAGYSYLIKQDMRLNPEHPPLLKDLSALPLLALDLNFPSEHPSWTKNVNDQWDFGHQFLYQSGNNADAVIFLARLAPIVLMILLGFFVWRWTRELYGDGAALLALFFFAFSPTTIAHGRLVTTDLAAAAGFFIAAYYFINFLQSQTRPALVYAGMALAFALLLKFSTILLIPYFIILALAFTLIYGRHHWFSHLYEYAGSVALIFLIAGALIWPVYQFHVANYPPEKQKNDTEFILRSHSNRPLADAIGWMADKPGLRPYGQYLLGLAMVGQRASGGNTTYFMGEISNASWKSYFPVVYLLKEPLALHVLSVIALTILGSVLISRRRLRWIMHDHFPQAAMIFFIGLYWFVSLSSNLNIGVRHLIPTLPFVYLLVAGTTVNWVKRSKAAFVNWRRIFVTVMALWIFMASLAVYPYYLAYFNEIAGGPPNGYRYVVDSNLDWGQDLKRLADFIEFNNIEKIKVDYFGGGSPEYYLGEKVEPLHADMGPQNGWLAVSATFYQTSRGNPAASYAWLDNFAPVAKIGYSIFVYNIR